MRNVLEPAVVLCRNGRLETDAIPKEIRRCNGYNRPAREAPQAPQSITKWLQAKVEAEVETIAAALASNENNRSRATIELGISRVTLYKKLHKYGLIESR